MAIRKTAVSACIAACIAAPMSSAQSFEPAAATDATEAELLATAQKLSRSAAVQIRQYLPEARFPRVDINLVKDDSMVLSGRPDGAAVHFDLSSGALTSLSAQDLTVLVTQQLLAFIVHRNHDNPAVEKKFPAIAVSEAAHRSLKQDMLQKKLDQAGQDGYLDTVRADKAAAKIHGQAQVLAALKSLQQITTAGGVVQEIVVAGDPSPTLRVRIEEAALGSP